MDLSEYGPFATIIAITAALISSFSFILVNAFGRLYQWTWLIHDTPPFMVRACVKVLAIALIAITFLTIDKQNYIIFAIGSLLFGAAMIVFFFRFDKLRRLHIVRIPITGPNGNQVHNQQGKPQFNNLVIGTECTMFPDAAANLKQARMTNGGLSLTSFMSGYGTQFPNNPEALWSRELLVKISNRLTMYLIGMALCSVLVLFLGASSIEMHMRSPSPTEESSITVPAATEHLLDPMKLNIVSDSN